MFLEDFYWYLVGMLIILFLFYLFLVYFVNFFFWVVWEYLLILRLVMFNMEGVDVCFEVLFCVVVKVVGNVFYCCRGCWY